MSFVILVRDLWSMSTDVYAGKTYIHQGQYFPCLVDSENPAKKYSNRKIAERAASRLKDKTGQTCEVMEVEGE
ncbi:hypothetical protein FQU75_00050 [Paenibacillus polymyxa]|uniref:hypothetical protein n=1 Tax=Paenibacillus polymyxa TaxID=1406 RepID=UPI000D8CF85A|nr:hypothetical protein [Paenibacillus polymyxa]QDY81912.1 hypothetical protein FQU75_00050 [Paenibacillus polymyxa]SPY16930.1 Uncharacterised protein [Paenibacillus polymyxa]